MKLKPCPCGEVPESIHPEYIDQPHKYQYCYPSCCNEWNIEFKAMYVTGAALEGLAIKAWNEAPRGEK
ncbi:MAG: hypothetical protein QM500_18190 [Methylococcales bacterium]